MSLLKESTRARSARHYIIDGPLAVRLQSTLALVAQSLGFPVVRVNILDEDTQYTFSMFGVGDATAILARRRSATRWFARAARSASRTPPPTLDSRSIRPSSPAKSVPISGFR